jgi:glycosyltransferase involved in cell wall biosynthesis
LRAAGADAHYAYVGGYKLQAKLAHYDFAHPLIEKAQNPLAFRRSVDAIDRMIHVHGFDVIHAHLTYDHWLARFAARPHGVKIARTFHARRVLRTDPFTRSLISRTNLLCVVNDTFNDSPALSGRTAIFTPPPLDTRQFTPAGGDVRAQYGIDASTKLVTVIGKLSRDRGFEEALQTFAALRPLVPSARLMIIGHGEHRPVLEALAASLRISEHVLWAGYHEDDLAEHYRASDLLLFTARGSDEGHRAVLEAMGCGVPPVTFPIDGVAALLGDLGGELIASTSNPADLAAVAARALQSPSPVTLRKRVAERAQEFAYTRAAQRLLDAYQSLM